MKKITFRKIFMSVISLVLIFAMLSPNLTVLAASASGGSRKPTADQIAVVEKQLEAMKNQQKKAQTVDKQQVINDELYKWAKERQDTEKERADKEKFDGIAEKLSVANDALPFVIDTIKDIADGGDFDTATFIGGVTDLACGILSCIAPWGTVASIGLQMAMTLITTLLGGDAGPSEMELMEDRLNQRLDEIADQISEVQEKLAEISDQINESTEKIINSVTGAIENETDKNHLRDFMLSSGQGDFSYNALRNAIYGSSKDNRNGMTAYYALLLDAQLRGGSSTDIKHFYDLLYATLVNNRAAFHDYIIGDGFGKSIVATYYDVISMRPDLTAEMGKSAEMATIEFAYDLYQTEMMMDQLILICNNYQYAQMLINGTDYYDYGSGIVLASDIHNPQKKSNIADSLRVGIDEVRMQLAEDIIYVLGTTTSYVVEHEGQFYYLNTIEDEDGTIYAPVLKGQTVYLNTVSAMVSNQFDLDAQSFLYSGRGIMDQTGIVQITELNIDDSVTLSYVDDNGSSYSLGTITFTNAQEQPFCGGMGTAESPYLIANADQFLNIALDMTAHYRLIADVNFAMDEIDPLGFSLNSVDSEVYEEFTGVLDGNGYAVRNVNITGHDHSGIFAKIGYEGVVKNLTFDNVHLKVEISEAKTSSSTYTGGIIAGTNNGTIKSCVVNACYIDVDSETDNAGAERSVYLKYGGLCGANNGQMTAVMVKATRVDVSSSHSFGGASTDANKNNVFVGGICGTCMGYLDYAAADENVVLRAYVKSTLNPNTTVNPYLQAFVGGITTQEGLNVKTFDNITNIYSAVKSENLKAERELKIQSRWGKHYRNAKTEKDVLIPTVSDEKLKKIGTTLTEVENAFYKAASYTLSITDTTGNYPIGAMELNQANLEVLVDGEKVEYFYLINVYGFDTRNESFNNTRKVNTLVQINALVDGEMRILNGKLPITIDKNRVASFQLINYEEVYLKGQTPATTAMLNQTDANGKTTTVNNATIEILNAATATANVGTSVLEIGYQGATASLEIEVLCNVHYSFYDYDNPAHYTFVETVAADCQHGGYDAYLCAGCGEEVKTNRTGMVAHNLVRDVSREATCAEPGVIGKIYCTYCDTVFEEQVELPRLAHNIVHTGDPHNHSCTVCQKSYAHEYVVSESLVDGKVTYTYTCYSCGYVGQKQDTNIITNEERLRPAVVVSDGFALAAGDLVTVYVDLENNPGVNGANLGIRYDERLELVQWYEGEFFAGTTTAASHAVSCGYNYVWGTEAARSEEGGNLLKLVFRLPDDATAQDSYDVSVVYSVVAESEGGFSLPDNVCAKLGIPSNHPQKFKTKDGVIRVVDRLPGDIDNNNAVNLLDALYLSNCLVNQEQYPITTEIKHYGDVNLDAYVTVNDVVKILQSISGGYGASLMAPEYRIQLNTNGFAYQPDALFVQLYGAANTYAALADIEQAMQQREGYRFLGWYTRLEGGVKIDAANYQTQLVSYDRDQKVQTLYAHWEKNTVSFDMNGATSQWLDKETYLGNGAQWITLIAPVEEYTVIFTDPNNANSSVTEKMSRPFAYWQGSDGNKYYAGDPLPVHKLNMGELTLTATWGEWELNFPALEKTGYDASQITWCTNAHTTDVLSGDVYAVIKAMPEKVLYAKWTKPITYYVHYDANGGTGTLADSVHKYDESKQLSENADPVTEKPVFTHQYNVTFHFGESGQSDSTTSVTHKFKGWSRDGQTLLPKETLVDNWTAQAGKVITVYAVWDTQTVTLATPKDYTGYTFKGWYTDAAFVNVAGVTGQPGTTFQVTGPCTLYGKWVANAYTVAYEKNTMGTGNASTGNSDQCYSAPTWKDQSNADSITYGVTGSYLDIPQTDHYNFVGWFTAPVGGTQITDSNGKVLKADAFAQNDTRLYAHWTPMYSGTYVYDEESLGNIGDSGVYHIVRDITLNNTWTPIETFSGVIDGHGHTISNVLYMTRTDGTNAVIDYGFVRVLTGTIKNVTFADTKIEIIKSKDNQHNNNVGGVAGTLRGGTLENVTMLSPYVYSEHFREVAASGNYSNSRAGGLVGHMESGTIINCSVTGTGGVFTWAKRATDRADCQAFSGGIVGYMTGGTISGCSRGDSVKISSASEVDGKNCATRAASGGIIGVRDGGTYTNCTSSTNNLIVSWKDTGSYSKNYSWKVTGAIVGRGG